MRNPHTASFFLCFWPLDVSCATLLCPTPWWTEPQQPWSRRILSFIIFFCEVFYITMKSLANTVSTFVWLGRGLMDTLSIWKCTYLDTGKFSYIIYHILPSILFFSESYCLVADLLECPCITPSITFCWICTFTNIMLMWLLKRYSESIFLLSYCVFILNTLILICCFP